MDVSINVLDHPDITEEDVIEAKRINNYRSLCSLSGAYLGFAYDNKAKITGNIKDNIPESIQKIREILSEDFHIVTNELINQLIAAAEIPNKSKCETFITDSVIKHLKYILKYSIGKKIFLINC